MDKNRNSSEFNLSSGKLICVLETMAQMDGPVRVNELAAATKMNPTTVLRFLNSLVHHGYVTQLEDSGRYAMTFKICRIAEMVKQNNSMVSHLHKYLVLARDLFGETANLAKEENRRVVYIDVAAGTSPILSTYRYIGTTAPMHCTGIGKLLLLEYSPSQLDALISTEGLARFTENTFTTKASLCEELNTIRQQGYAVDNEECEIGARCLAVPIRNYTGKIVAGISVTGPVTRLNEETLYNKLDSFIEIGKAASRAIGYNE